MEVLIHVPGIKRGIEGAKGWFVAQSLFDHAHQREEIADIGLIERLGEFGQYEFTPVRHFGGRHTGSVAPIIFAYRDGSGRNGIVGGGGRRLGAGGALVVPTFAAQLTVRITSRLLGLVEAIGHVGFEIVLLHPCQDRWYKSLKTR